MESSGAAQGASADLGEDDDLPLVARTKSRKPLVQRAVAEEEVADSPTPDSKDHKASPSSEEESDASDESEDGSEDGLEDGSKEMEEADEDGSGTSSLGKRSAPDVDGAYALRRGEGVTLLPAAGW